MTAPLLTISDLHVEIGEGQKAARILRGVNLELRSGHIGGLVGESGGGKTMVGKAITGLLPGASRITKGSILFEGRDLLRLSDRERRQLLGRAITMILQQPTTALNPVLRIESQIVDVLQRHMGLGRAAAHARAIELLDMVRIRHPERVLRQYPHELSGGMCQRVVIAIAFACEPKLIVADEPTTALDVTVQLQILRLIRDMQKRSGAAVLFITHDLGVVAKICDTTSVIFAGRILESGRTEDIFAQPSHAYTMALMAASPRHDQPEKGLVPVSPDLTEQLWRDAAAYDAEQGRA